MLIGIVIAILAVVLLVVYIVADRPGDPAGRGSSAGAHLPRLAAHRGIGTALVARASSRCSACRLRSVLRAGDGAARLLRQRRERHARTGVGQRSLVDLLVTLCLFWVLMRIPFWARARGLLRARFRRPGGSARGSYRPGRLKGVRAIAADALMRIPADIDREDPLVFGLSARQLCILGAAPWSLPGSCYEGARLLVPLPVAAAVRRPFAAAGLPALSASVTASPESATRLQLCGTRARRIVSCRSDRRRGAVRRHAVGRRPPPRAVRTAGACHRDHGCGRPASRRRRSARCAFR